MLHGFRPEYAGQGRGFSRIAHAIQEFENLTDFSSSVIKRAINQSSIVGFIQPSADEDASNPFEDILTNAGAGPAAQIFGADPQPVPGIPVAPEPGSPGLDAYYRVPEATIDTPGSMFLGNLTKGSTMVFPSLSAPADSYNTFVDAFAGYLSASTGTPLEVVLMKFGQNYSASRATLLLFWRIAKGWEAEMDSDLLSPVVEMWLAGEIAAGRVSAPGWSDPRLRAAWLHKNWMGSSPPDIDPVKTAKANQLNIEIGATNLDRVARDLNGSSAAANLEKNRTLFKQYELPPWLVKQPAAAEGPVDGKAQALLEHIVDLIENGG
jgi:capsid protein